MKIIGWRAYYAGGITYDSDETRYEELPDGLIGVVEFLEPPYRKIVCGGDWLYMEDGRWHETDTMWDGWVERPKVHAKRGKALPDEAWSKAQARMLNDREWPDG